MATELNRFLKKSIASFVAAALILTAPGLGVYEALAANFAAGAVKAVTVVPGGATGAGLGSLGKTAVSGTIPLAPLNITLTGTLKSVSSFSSVLPVARTNGFIKANEPVTAAQPASQGGGIEGVNPDNINQPHKAVVGTRLNANRPTGGGHGGPKAKENDKSKGRSGIPDWAKAASISRMSVSDARSAGRRLMDKILGRTSIATEGSVAGGIVSGKINAAGRMRGLRPATLSHSADFAGIPPASIPGNGGSKNTPAGPSGRFFGFIKSVAMMAVGAGAVYGIHAAALFLAPALFGALPVAAVWAVSSGVFILPIALYSRYRLGLRDSSRLKGVKVFNDLAIGALLGAVAVAAPVFFSGAVLQGLSAAIPAVIGLTYAATATSQNSDGVVGGWINAALTWASLTFLTPLFGTVATALPITLGSVFGLMAIPALVTISFFLGRIILSAESGRPFTVPGSLRKIRFPSYTWVMTGVVFALLSGYNPVWTNAAFGVWMFLGSKKWFNYAYFGILAWSIATGFAAPVTFLAIAFLPERASMWTEKFLEKMLPAGKPAPSTAEAKVRDNYIDKPERWPKFRFWMKTFFILGALATAGFLLGQTVFGFSSLFINLAVASGLSLIPLIFAKWIIKKTMRAEPMNEEEDPEVFGIMRELRERINKERAKKGKKLIPMPEMVNVPMQVPNAFATGMTPMNAMVGVTYEMKDMMLKPERTREGVVRLLYNVDPQSKSFHVFRKAVRGSIPNINDDAGPQEVIQAVQDAEPAQIKALGVRALRGVMGHEFNHVMHYDMILGALTGAIASGISFASYGVLWAAGHAEAFLRGLWARISGKETKAKKPAKRGKPPVRAKAASGESDSTPAATPGPVKPEVVEPVSTAVGVAAILGLAKIFVALWAPVMARLLQMASGRTREGHADEGGALLTEDPESLALGLGLLTSWRPVSAFTFDRAMLPRLSAQANVMTVNPLAQLRDAGALPNETKKDAKGRGVTKADDWFFQLFLTHPDTTQRIERLHDMAEAMSAKKSAAAQAEDEASTSRPDGSVRMAMPEGGASDGVDPASTEALAKPGLDERLNPLVDVLKEEITSSKAKFDKMGHLLWTLEELIKQGGLVRYAYTFDPETGAPLSGFFNPSEKALYINDTILRSNPRLQGAILAGYLQQAYDHLNGRAAGTQEAGVRQILARDAFLEGADMGAIAESVDIGSVVSVELLEEILQGRLWAASGMSALERIFGENVSIHHLIQRGKDHVSLLKKELADLEDQRKLFTDGLKKDKGNESYGRQVRVLSEKIGIKKGNILVAETQLKMAAKEQAVEGSLLTPLAVDKAHTSRLDRGDLKIVKVKVRPKVDPALKSVLDLISKTIRESKDPAIKNLVYIEKTVEKLLASGGHIMFAPPGDGAAAYFSPVTLDVVIGREFARTDPALIAALMVHELTHAADYFGVPQEEGEPWTARPLTRETERNAFTNEAIFIGAFEPEAVAKRLNVNNPMEHAAYQLVFHARMKYVEGKTSLEAMISDAYRELFGAHFSGLQTAMQLKVEIQSSKLAKIVEAYQDLSERTELTRSAVESGQETRRVQLQQMERALELYKAYITVYNRQIEQLDLEAGTVTEGEGGSEAPAGFRAVPQAGVGSQAFGVRRGT